MKVVNTIEEVRKEISSQSCSLGLVPTMGYLHEGHLNLVRRARNENEKVVVSIFVNPTQFGTGEDLGSYPSDIESDLKLLENEGTDLVFNPSSDVMYPDGFDTWTEVGGLSRRLEGEFRPGHFRGVATVVLKLINIAQPDRAYFGQKDAQQLMVIKKLVLDLNLNVEIVAVPIAREVDGLARSSRNIYLTSDERGIATTLFKSLNLAKDLYENGVRDAEKIKQEISRLIESQGVSAIDYVSIADTETLEELDFIDRTALVSLAVTIGKARLIDNVILHDELAGLT